MNINSCSFININTRRPQSFGAMYIDDKSTYEKMKKLASDERLGDDFQKAFIELNDAAKNQDIQISTLNKGVCVTKINGKTGALYKVLSADIKDFVWGLHCAVAELKKEDE